MFGRLAATVRRQVAAGGVGSLKPLLYEASFATATETTRAQVSPVVSAKTAQLVSIALLGGVGAFALYWGINDKFSNTEEQTTFINWSHTHEVTPWRCFTPETQKEVEQIVRLCHEKGERVRVVGSGLSPNGIAFTSLSMMDMSLMDKIIYVDSDKKQIRIQCGARVESVVEALRAYGLTLQNYASIKEQQIGGFMQIGAHGTGAAIPPVDEQVVSMKIVTPGMGTLELSRDDPDPTLFYTARVGLGCFGVVTEVTIQCVPEHKLVERSFVTTFREVKKHHTKWLAANKHLRYLWIPHTESVVVIQCNPLTALNAPRSTTPAHSAAEQTEAMRRLIATRAVDGKVGSYAIEQLEELTFTELRDVALLEAPLETEWVKKVNLAEEAYWKKAAGVRVGWSDQILGFDCGGQQWVLEVAVPSGTVSKPSIVDLDFVEDIMKLIKKHKVPAHSPIEHRWTSSSRSYLSPAHSANKDDVHAWVGIILYLPTDDSKIRQNITSSFGEYAQRVETGLLPKYNGTWHWGKLEVDRVDKRFLRKRLQEKLPMEQIELHRKKLDPRNVLENRITSTIFSADHY